MKRGREGGKQRQGGREREGEKGDGIWGVIKKKVKDGKRVWDKIKRVTI